MIAKGHAVIMASVSGMFHSLNKPLCKHRSSLELGTKETLNKLLSINCRWDTFAPSG
jgi:hypothetical protein